LKGRGGKKKKRREAGTGKSFGCIILLTTLRRAGVEPALGVDFRKRSFGLRKKRKGEKGGGRGEKREGEMRSSLLLESSPSFLPFCVSCAREKGRRTDEGRKEKGKGGGRKGIQYSR